MAINYPGQNEFHVFADFFHRFSDDWKSLAAKFCISSCLHNESQTKYRDENAVKPSTRERKPKENERERTCFVSMLFSLETVEAVETGDFFEKSFETKCDDLRDNSPSLISNFFCRDPSWNKIKNNQRIYLFAHIKNLFCGSLTKHCFHHYTISWNFNFCLKPKQTLITLEISLIIASKITETTVAECAIDRISGLSVHHVVHSADSRRWT